LCAVVSDNDLAFPDYDGNGMFKSLGNILVNPAVGVLFIDMGEKPRRLRVNGTASISRDDPLMRSFPGAQLLVRVRAQADIPQLPTLHRHAGIGRAVQVRAAARATNHPSQPGRLLTTSRTTCTRGKRRRNEAAASL
jgi:hypothetical protein